jgi:phenylalanyl-tRNA synthetase alpha chain
MFDELKDIRRQAKEEIGKADSQHELNMLKSRFLGKKSKVVAALKQMGSLSPEERPAYGKVVNQIKGEIQALISQKAEELKKREYEKALYSQKIDLTMPGRKPQLGTLHPIIKAWRELEDIFLSMGFQIAEGFDVEDEFHNFDALNTPPDHPARELSDTFYIKDDVLLRTQTSTVQVRVMQKYKPPIKIIAPGRCYRNDNDASHSPAFHQVEGLVVDEDITFADLKDILHIFVHRMFGREIDSRFRPHFFPFTEPSAEMDISCVNCGGTGCNVCKHSGWLEMGGAGMVDPNVFDMLDIDSEKFTGYAFGLGIDRIAMLKYRIPDMRMLFENDVRFLKQFR